MLSIGPETPDQPDVRRLLDQADLRSASLYPSESRFGLNLTELLSQQIRFLVARESGQAVGCSGYALLPERLAELKRIFVVPEARGQGYGGRIVLALEQAAQAEGVGGLLLETGIKSVEAIGLYSRLGYVNRGPFGPYGPDPLSVFMEKTLAPA